MATIIKNRARKLSACGPVTRANYVNLAMVGLLRNKHVVFEIGDHRVRIELDSAKELAQTILEACKLGEEN